MRNWRRRLLRGVESFPQSLAPDILIPGVLFDYLCSDILENGSLEYSVGRNVGEKESL
jgi:hypothetical protein